MFIETGGAGGGYMGKIFLEKGQLLIAGVVPAVLVERAGLGGGRCNGRNGGME
jgi:hypothetical protein